MKHKLSQEQFEELLRGTFAPDRFPSPEINHTLFTRLEEKELYRMEHKFVGKIPVLAAAFCLLLTVSVFASWHFLSASSVAEQSIPELSAAFDQEDATKVNAVRTLKGYIVSLLGLTSGAALENETDAVDKNSTYAVVAIGKEDGTPINMDDSYFASPLIQGLTPWQYNIASMGGAYSQFIENGILYRLFNCDDIEIFADRKLYLCVTDTPFYPTEAFHMDEATGLITEAKDFDGLNILFDLPLDPAKADPERAKQYIDSLWNDSDDGGEEIPSLPEMTVEEILKKGTVVESSRKVLTPDKNGMLSYSFSSKDSKMSESASEEFLFPDGAEGLSPTFSLTDDGAILYEKAKDGTITAFFVELETSLEAKD